MVLNINLLEKKKEKMKTSNLPKHVGIIMDGNRRWAKKKGLGLLFGHKIATERIVEPLIEKAGEMGILYLTLWCFSTENWKRSKKEVAGLMEIFREAIDNKLQRIKQKGAKIRIIGNKEHFSEKIQKSFTRVEKETENNTKINVNFAFSYGGREEIIRSVNKWLDKKIQNRTIFSEKELEENLDTFGQPDPDLIIRTGGEKRLSGFLIWQAIYAELYFTDSLFPDFTVEEFTKAILDYQKRQRRFGK